MKIIVMAHKLRSFKFDIVNDNKTIYGGERGIRTLDSIATIHAFQALRLENSEEITTIIKT